MLLRMNLLYVHNQLSVKHSGCFEVKKIKSKFEEEKKTFNFFHCSIAVRGNSENRIFFFSPVR